MTPVSDPVLDALRAQFLVEEGRAQSINGRGANLAGLGGIVLSLLTFAVSGEVRGGESAFPDSATWMIVVALWLLVAAIVVVVARVLRPQAPKDFSGDELAAIADDGDVVGALRKRTAEAVSRGRQINNSKAGGLHIAGNLVCAAVTLAALAGTILAL